MSFTRDDKENRKFESDPTDSSKVVVKTKVENQASDPVPVSIVNPDSNIDLEVTIQPNITIDDSTPIDVNISNAAVATNATIQGTPAVSVTGNVDIDDATAIRVDVTNAAVATNATIQNSHINVYDKLYNGSAWVNQLSDNDGRAIVLNKKYYSAADITALGSSTSVREWVSAYSDDILEYKYVQTFDDEHPKVVYYTHPDLGDSNKCLKFSYTYTTQNSVKVVQSVFITVVDWTFDSAITGTVTLTLGTITSPNPSSAIAVGTDICTVAAAASGGGAITLALSGTNASLYTLRNVTDGTTGASLAYDAAKSFVLETANDFSGSSYSHSVTITATEATFGLSTSSNVATSGTFVAGSPWANNKYVSDSYRGIVSSTALVGNYYRDSSSDKKGFFPTLDQASAFRSSNNVSYSFWSKFPSGNSGFCVYLQERYDTDVSDQSYFAIYKFGSELRIYCTYNDTRNYRIYNLTQNSAWKHIVVTTTSADVVTGATLYVDGSVVSEASSGTSETITRTGHSVNALNVGGMLLNKSASNGTFGYQEASGTFIMDELTTWKKTLSASEVTELYNSGTPADPSTHSAASDLERYFSFGDNSSDGVNIYDEEDGTVFLQSYDSQDNTVTTTTNLKNLEGSPYHGVAGTYFESGNKGFFSNTTSFQDMSSFALTVNFWYYKPSSYSGENTLFGDFAGNAGHCFFSASAYGDLIFYSNIGTSYKYAGITLPSGYEDEWIFVTAVFNSSANPTAIRYYLQNSSTFDNTAYTPSITTGTADAFAISSGTTIDTASIFGARTYNNAVFPTSSGGMSSNTFMIDELTCFNKNLSLAEIEELHNNHVPFDYTTHSANSDLFRYIRFGDGDNDTESVIKCEIDSGFALDKNGSASGTFINNLTASEDPYVS